MASIRNIKKGNAPRIDMVFMRFNPPALKIQKVRLDINNPHRTFLPTGGFNCPLDVIIPRTKTAESADVTKNVERSNMAKTEMISPKLYCFKTINNVKAGSATEVFPTSGATFRLKIPNAENQNMLISVGTRTTARINSFIVLPFEILAIKAPTIGVHAIQVAHIKIVQSAVQVLTPKDSI